MEAQPDAYGRSTDAPRRATEGMPPRPFLPVRQLLAFHASAWSAQQTRTAVPQWFPVERKSDFREKTWLRLCRSQWNPRMTSYGPQTSGREPFLRGRGTISTTWHCCFEGPVLTCCTDTALTVCAYQSQTFYPAYI